MRQERLRLKKLHDLSQMESSGYEGKDVSDHDDSLKLLDEALARFELEDPQKALLVKLRYFGGLTLEQAAVAIGVSRATADRYWSYARAWLRVALRSEEISHSAEKKQNK